MNDTDQQRLGVVVVTHGQLANELVNAAEMIAGEQVRFQAVALGWHDDKRMADDYELAETYFKLDKPFDVKAVYTNEFLDRSIKMTAPKTN